MKVLNSEELKKIQLDILKDFAKFCDDNDITYYLGGGTLLGAIRHKGFIPWDDDIDIMMPRNDFNKALKLYNNKNYKFLYISNCDIWEEQIAKVCDIRTYLCSKIHKNTKYDEIVNCVGIDVCPLDGLPDNSINQKILFAITKVIIAIHSASVLKLKSTNRFNDKYAGFLSYKKHVRNFLKFICILFLGWSNPRFWVNRLNFFITKRDFYQCKFVAGIASCVHGEKEIMPKCVFQDKVLVDFENYKFWSPVGYDYYLKRLYGDYMELPPEIYRKPHHDFIAYMK